MKISCLMIFTASLVIATPVFAKDDASANDLKKLSGTWLTVSLVNDGVSLVDENTPTDENATAKLAYDGNKWMVKVENKTIATGMIKIDATKMPKEIDVMDDSGKKNDKTQLGIYELDGDTYRYCIAPAGKSRPKEFTSAAGSGHSLAVSKREKP